MKVRSILSLVRGLGPSVRLSMAMHTEGPLGYALRRLYWGRRLARLGRGVRIEPGVWIQRPEFVELRDGAWIDRGTILLAGPDESSRPRRTVAIPGFPMRPGDMVVGARVHVGPGCVLSGMGGMLIGDDCCLAAGTKAYSLSHHFRSDLAPEDQRVVFGALVEMDRQFMIEGGIWLEENVGVAMGSVLLPGTHLRANSFVAINSVVSGSFDENSLVAGSPARRVRERFEEPSRDKDLDYGS